MIVFKDVHHLQLVRAYMEGVTATNSATDNEHEFMFRHDATLDTDVVCDEPEGPMRVLVLGFRAWRHSVVHDTCTCEQYDCQHFTRLMQLSIVTRLLEVALAQVEKQTSSTDAVIGRLLKLTNIDEKMDAFLKDVLRDPE